MHILLIVHAIVDRLLTLLPGKASDPTSLEARVRRAGSTADALFDRAQALMTAAAAREEAIEKDVADKAKQAVTAAERGITALEARVAKLKELI